MGHMIADGSGFEAISEAEALALLATAPVGRLIYSDRALPFVVPVSFVVDGARHHHAHRSTIAAGHARTREHRGVRG